MRFLYALFLLLPYCHSISYAQQACFKSGDEWEEWKTRTAQELVQINWYKLKSKDFLNLKEKFDWVQKCNKDPQGWLSQNASDCTLNIDQNWIRPIKKAHFFKEQKHPKKRRPTEGHPI